MAQAVIEPDDTTPAHSTAASSFTGTICGLLGITDQYSDDADDSAMAVDNITPADNATVQGAIRSGDMHDRYSFAERARYIPLRLSLEERQYLRLLESALSVSNYTSIVDGDELSVSKRRHKQMELISALLAGLVTAIDYPKGQELLEEREFVQHEGTFQDLFEIGRRHKIMNPGKSNLS
jgi:Protein of unknown function (DUF2009)